jgi:REP element-mobilizing transposase RayT
MRHRAPYTELYVHLVWATWGRLPLITPEIRGPIYRDMARGCHELGAHVVSIGGMEDHVHLLARIPTTLTIARLAAQVKGSSSHLVGPNDIFRWQGGYGAFTVSKEGVDPLKAYILDQPRHHAGQTLKPDLERSAHHDLPPR